MNRAETIVTVRGYEVTSCDVERFYRLVAIGAFSVCWNWNGCLSKGGYGHFKIGGKKGTVIEAHRFAYAAAFPELYDEEMHYLHSCDNRACCNTNHLGMGTHAQNMKEAALRGRTKSPRPGNGVTKIAVSSRAVIRGLSERGLNNCEIARCYGVTPSRIRQILSEIKP